MKKIVTICLLLGALLPAGAQRVLSLDSCRAMALRNNKQINVSKFKKDVAYNLRKSARTKYLPKVDAMGGYEWFSREISLLNNNQKSTFSNVGTNIGSNLSGGLNNLMGELVSNGLIRVSSMPSAQIPVISGLEASCSVNLSIWVAPSSPPTR